MLCPARSARSTSPNRIEAPFPPMVMPWDRCRSSSAASSARTRSNGRFTDSLPFLPLRSSMRTLSHCGSEPLLRSAAAGGFSSPDLPAWGEAAADLSPTAFLTTERSSMGPPATAGRAMRLHASTSPQQRFVIVPLLFGPDLDAAALAVVDVDDLGGPEPLHALPEVLLVVAATGELLLGVVWQALEDQLRQAHRQVDRDLGPGAPLLEDPHLEPSA